MSRRPNALRYSFTLHAPEGERLMGFDNAHPVAAHGRYTKRQVQVDHWHRTGNDPGRTYAFKNAATLIEDFFAEVARILTERGIPIDALADGLNNERTKP